MARPSRRSVAPTTLELEDRCTPAAVFRYLFQSGNADLRLDYSGTNWDFRVRNEATGYMSYPYETIVYAPDLAFATAPTGAAWNFLGASELYILPENANNGLVNLTASSRGSSANDFPSYQPNDPRVITADSWLRADVVAVRGPGNFSIFQQDGNGNPIVWVATSDGLGATDSLYLGAGLTGTKYSWAFTNPGVYEVDFQVTGYQGANQTSPLVSPVVTYYFSVVPPAPDVVPPPAQSSVNESDVVFSAANGNPIGLTGPVTAPAPMEAIITAGFGTVLLGSTNGISITGGANGSSSVEVLGLLSDIRNAIDGLSYRPNPGFNGIAGVSVEINDRGEYRPFGQSGSGTAVINVSGNTGTRAPDPLRSNNSGPVDAVGGPATPKVVVYGGSNNRWVAVGGGVGDGSRVDVYEADTHRLASTYFAYDPLFTGGVRIAVGDVNGDGTADIITAPGAGGGPNVKVFDGSSSTARLSFFAYGANFTGGVAVAVADFTGDGIPEIITGAGPGGGPHVRIFNGRTGAILQEFFAFESKFRGGVWIAAGDVTGDGNADIVIGAGPGGGPAVAIFDGALGTVIKRFFVYDPSFNGGVYVGTADVTGDKVAELITGAASGGGPHVQIFDARTNSSLSSFFAADPRKSAKEGVRVAGVDTNGDGIAELFTAAGAGTVKNVSLVTFPKKLSDPSLEEFPILNPFSGAVFVGGQ